MTHPTRTRLPNRNTTNLLAGCGSAALAMAMALSPHKAEAQAFGGSGSVVFGAAEINNIGTGTDQVDVFTPTVVIDWIPNEDINGNALDFLPTGTTGIFQSTDVQNFAVLNRILPSTNGNVTVMDGSIISQFIDPQTGLPTRSGFVAFYSPTGLLIGDNATFDVGSLMLTTLDITATDFENFSQFGGSMAMTGQTGSIARVQINPGAQITATAENSFFAVVAADVQMLGTAQINGSHAYVAGEVVNLSFSNGLFDISVPVGTAASGTVIQVDGDVGGPSSNGLGDNHMIYALARAGADPISMIFSGNLGFDTAQSAGVVNGEIILSANYNIFGRSVASGTLDAIDPFSFFTLSEGELTTTAGSVFLADFNASSSVLAIANQEVQVSAVNAPSVVDGDLFMISRRFSELTASNGQTFDINGNVMLGADGIGFFGANAPSLASLDGIGGTAFIDAFGGGILTINGDAFVSARGAGGADTVTLENGIALGGSAQIGSTGGTLTITGNATASSGAQNRAASSLPSRGPVTGGLSEIFSRDGGVVTIGGTVDIEATASSAFGSVNPFTAGEATGGTAILGVDGTGSIGIGGSAFLSTFAGAGLSFGVPVGATARGGTSEVFVNGPGAITVSGNLGLAAIALGGDNDESNGQGGLALGGIARASTVGGTLLVGGTFSANANGEGGDGQTGGDGFGGIAGANALTGSIDFVGSASATATGSGGNATLGFGGNGGLGRGGNSFFQANGTLTEAASLTIGLDVTLDSSGFGGQGGDSDGVTIAAGRGGDGIGGEFTTPNQADPAFNSGAFLLAGGDNGTLSVGGFASVSSIGFGGFGGFGGSLLPGGQGGDAFGGLAQTGLALLGGDGSLGLGSATFTLLSVDASGIGGIGGFSFGDFPTGNGGNATGGRALLQASAGDVIADSLTMFANGLGGDGALGGDGTGGERSGASTSGGGTITLGTFAAYAHGAGGTGFGLGGGNGQGGQAFMGFQGGTTLVNGDVIVDGSGFGGVAFDGGTGGNGTGGIADLAIFLPVAGSGTITGNAAVIANGIGGAAGSDGLTGGDGVGGRAFIQSQAGGTIRIGSTQVTASGLGGSLDDDAVGILVTGGNGTGGSAELLSSDTGSQLIIERNVTTDFRDQLNNGAIAAALGFGGDTTGGTGIGGIGTGGNVLLRAAPGSSIALPADPFNDPGSVGPIFLVARGFGGDSSVDGGAGGTGFGGNASIDVDGGSLTMGEALMSSFTQGGTAFNGALDVTGGDAFGGSRIVSIRGGATATLNLSGGGPGAIGGAGTGSADGGNSVIGLNRFEIVNSTVDIVGRILVFDQSAGGTGHQGGNVLNVNPLTGATGALEVVLDNAVINFIPDAIGRTGVSVVGTTFGGDGIVRGGDAAGPVVDVTIIGTDLSGAPMVVNPIIAGGAASAIDGVGGNAVGSLITTTVSNSLLTLPGETLFAADARGGAGGANGVGGSAISGSFDANFTDSTITLVADPLGAPGILRVRSQADGGVAGTIGDATSNRAALSLTNSTVAGAEVEILAQAFAGAFTSGQTGADAVGGEARLDLAGSSGITADLVAINSTAETAQGGSATGGSSVLEAGTGSAAIIDAPQVALTADGTDTSTLSGGNAAPTQGGQARLGATGGNLTITGETTLNANGFGPELDGLLTGATVRGGLAQVFAQQGGQVTLGGDLGIFADAVGADSFTAAPLSVSDAFAGQALINIFNGGGLIDIAGSAVVSADARGGDSNNAGVGSNGVGGVAVANIDGPGLIRVGESIVLTAFGAAGDNDGGTGGIGRGGRASAATFSGGTIDIGGDFSAEASGNGGDGQTGNDAFGGIAGAIAVTGSIIIGGSAFADSEGEAGDALVGFGGNGGTGHGGNSFFQAEGTATGTASLTIALEAILSSDGIGGQGGEADGLTIAAGRGGDGIGGEFSTPNQADPNFNNGAFLLAGGDNGTLSVGGLAFVSSNGIGGEGGFGSSLQPGGQGGDGIGGLAQAGLALFGGDGSLGAGSATLSSLFVLADGVGGTGGFSINDFPTGDGGNGTGGGAFLTVRAGEVNAGEVQLIADGIGGEGVASGDGRGGQAAAFGGFGGALAASQMIISGQGFGGFTGQGTGGDAFGGLAAIEADGINVTVDGNAFLNASASAGASEDGAGGNATGGEAYVAMLAANTPGSIAITGHAQVFANALGGGTLTNFAAGNATGGLSFIETQAGSTITLGSAQVAAVGRGGFAQVHEGGDGTGGTARLGATGTGGNLIIERNVPTSFAETPGGTAIVNASGLGEATFGGNGIGGNGQGGTVQLVARGGGNIALPADPLNDPDSTGPIRLLSGGFGGGSFAEAGTGGGGFGGSGLIEADSGTIIMGRSNFSVYGQGGSSLDTTRNIAGGQAFGGSRVIRVINGGALTSEIAEGLAGGFGGNGSGSGNGGFAAAGSSRIEVTNGTYNVVGNLLWVDTSSGGSGAIGGDVFGGEGSEAVFDATDATIALTANSAGESGLNIGADLRGGLGITEGGDVTGGSVRFGLTNTDMANANVILAARATGGAATGPGGLGGNATAVSARFTATGSTIGLLGTNEISASAFGGAGGPQGSSGVGGTATSGAVNVTFTSSQVNVAADSSGPGILRAVSQADGGDGDQMGGAVSNIAQLQLNSASLIADEIGVEAFAFANANTAGQSGGNAQGGSAEIVLQGNAVLDAGLIELISNAGTSIGGTARAGTSALLTLSGSSAQVSAGDIILVSDASDGDPAQSSSTAGRIAVEVRGGTVTTGTLTGSALGDAVSDDLGLSNLIADGGSLLVSGSLAVNVLDDFDIETGGGGIIGGPTVSDPTADITITSQGTISIIGDDDNVIGFGGQSMTLTSRDIDVEQGARFGALNVSLVSLNTVDPAILGGEGGSDDPLPGEGYTFSADEASRMEVGEFTFFGPSLAGSDPNRADIVIRGVSIAGSLDDGTSAVRILGDSLDGIVRVEGTVAYTGAAPTDLFSISARRIEVVTPGGIRIQDLSGIPGGILSLSAADIWAADADTIAQLQANRSFAGRDALLAAAASGSADPLGYLRARSVTFEVGGSLLVRNTGVAFEGGGILVGDGGLSIRSTSQQSSGGALDVFAYGRRRAANGTFVVGEAFFDEVNFNRVAPGSTLYLDAAAFNDCIINTGQCPDAPVPPVQPPVEPPVEPPMEVPSQINNPAVINEPIQMGDEPPVTSEEEEERFGMDFPDQPDAALISEDPLLDDPVTSGGDASLYSGGSPGGTGDQTGEDN